MPPHPVQSGTTNPAVRSSSTSPSGRTATAACASRQPGLRSASRRSRAAREDVVLEDTHDFRVAPCETCGGRLKPDVVFFGENVPAARVERCYAAVDALTDRDGALLVAGSSLAVMSGFRFARRAAKAGTPVVIVNRGHTRADELATFRCEVGTSEFLTALSAARRAA